MAGAVNKGPKGWKARRMRARAFSDAVRDVQAQQAAAAISAAVDLAHASPDVRMAMRYAPGVKRVVR